MKKSDLKSNGSRFGAIAARRSSGFTLIELLIVIAIVAVLAAISFTLATKIKSKAQSAVCASNMRQVGTAMLEFAMDNQNKLPPMSGISPKTGKPAGIWPLLMASCDYLWDSSTLGTPKTGEGVWACPACTQPDGAHGGYGVAEETVIQYAQRVSQTNERIGRTELGSLRLWQIQDPSRTWLLGDAALKPDKLQQSWYAVWPDPDKWSNGHTPAERHGGKVHVCMVDGHMEALTIEQLKEGNYTLYK